jgi:hypothetical protein
LCSGWSTVGGAGSIAFANKLGKRQALNAAGPDALIDSLSEVVDALTPWPAADQFAGRVTPDAVILARGDARTGSSGRPRSQRFMRSRGMTMSGGTIFLIICVVVVALVLVPLLIGPSISRRRRDGFKSDTWGGPYTTSDYGGSGFDGGGGFGGY